MEELPRIEEIYAYARRFMALTGNPNQWGNKNPPTFQLVEDIQKGDLFVAEDETGKTVGGTGIGRLTDAVCELQKMYCLPEARGTGLAHKLMSVALDYARDYYAQCYLETLDNMTAAQRFYEKHGFARTDIAPIQTAHFACQVKYIRSL
jgi:putative acetyltransferase